jgi:hypothetical protein
MMQADRRGETAEWAKSFAFATALGLFLGLIGPFGSFLNGPVWQRAVYWVGMSWAGLAVYGPVIRLAHAWAPSRRAAWASIIGLGVLLTVPFAAFSWLFASSLWPVLKRLPYLTPALWYAECLILTLPQLALFTVLHGRRQRDEARAQLPAASLGVLGVAPAEVLCLQMEDHYVRVHARAGSRLVLATMAQAIAALGSRSGLRVHRSWWVAEDAVTGAVAEGRNLRLVLVNGLSAPVARASVAAVRAAGWLERGAQAGERQPA